jgi:hypothetical protein
MASTTDPNQIQNPSEIPPRGATPLGLTPGGLVQVFSGTLPGDVDATPAAQELLSAAADTAGLANADYIYDQVSRAYGGIQLPQLNATGGARAVAFVSGSAQGGYGAFHMGTTQAEFDRIVLDSLTATGNYSSGSTLGGAAIAPATTKRERRVAFVTDQGFPGLLGVTHPRHPRLEGVTKERLIAALKVAEHSVRALAAAHASRSAAALPQKNAPRFLSTSLEHLTREELAHELVRVNLIALQHVHLAAAASAPARQYLSTALFAAELIESFQLAANNADAGRTDGEAVSRVLSFKLAPEIALVPGFNVGVTQQWWQDGHQDFVNDNSQSDQSTDGNGAGVMFLLFLNDYLGIPLDEIIAQMPKKGGAPLGETYVNLLGGDPDLQGIAGNDGVQAFKAMVALLAEQVANPDGTLNLPADGNPFPALRGARQGGLFALTPAPSTTLTQDVQNLMALEAQLERQAGALKDVIAQIQANAPANSALRPAAERSALRYGPRLPANVAAGLAQQAAPFRAPQYDRTLQPVWGHVYNELPGTGTSTYRLQVITGTDQTPQAVQLSGTIKSTKFEPDGDLHIGFQPDDPTFPANASAQETPLEVEIIYAGPVTQADAKQASQGYTNPIDVSKLAPGMRIRVAGPLIYDRAHGKVDANGNVQYGLEIHPAVELEQPGGGPPPAPPQAGALAATVATALSDSAALAHTVADVTSLLQKLQGEIPS